MDFTASTLLELRLKAEQGWQDPQFAAAFQPKAEAAVAVLSNQTARFTEGFNNPEKDNKVAVTWINTCNIEAEDCEANCDLDEPELDSGKQLMEIDTCKKTGFSIDEMKLRTNDYNLQEVFTQGHAKAITTLDEFWAAQVLAKLKTFAGINQFPTPFTYDAVNKTTNVPLAAQNVKLVANFLQQAMLNDMPNPYFINNGTLWLEWMNSQLDSANLDGKGDINRIQQLKMYFDQFNFAKAGLTEDTFMINPNAVAMKTKVTHPDTPTVLGGKVGKTIFTVPSKVLPNVKYDVHYQLSCKVISGKTHYFHTWRYETNGGIWINPSLCPITVGETTVTPTGVLSYSNLAV